MSLFSRIGNAFRSGRVDRDLADEVEFHLGARIEELVRGGMTLRDAERMARRRFGNSMAMRESSREAKLVPWLESVAQDVRFGARVLLKNRGATAAAMASLSLALGACMAAFALIDALMLKTLPVYQPERLLYVSAVPDGPNLIERFSFPLYQRFAEAAREKADLFSMSSQFQWTVNFADSRGRTEKARVQWISGNAFAVLHLRPALGRLLAPDDDRSPGASPVAVISYRYWMRRFGGDPAVLGRWFTVDERQYRIVGVAEKSFSGIEPGMSSDIWAPNMMWPARAFVSPGWSWMGVYARLKAGATAGEVRERIQAVFTNFRRERVGFAFSADAPRDAVERYLKTPIELHSAAHGPSNMRRTFLRPLAILAVVAGLVLLIACSNLANLFTGRALAREREMAMRISIGAGRARLVQQVLIEGGLLAAGACIAGLAFARLAAPAIVGMLSRSDSPAYLDLQLDWRMLAFTAAAGLSTAVLFGLIPALQASRVTPGEALKSAGARHSARTAVLRPMVAAQVAFSFMVLFVSGLLVTTFQKLLNVDLGFSKEGVILFLVEAKQIPPNEQANVAISWLDRIRALPRVRSAAMSEWGLFSGSAWTDNVRVPGRAPDLLESIHLPVSQGFLQTMGIRLLSGRDFQPRDMDKRSPSVLVNESFARHYFPGEDPIGKRYWRSDNTPQQIVGLVTDAHYDQIWEKARSTVYVPLRGLNNGTLEVRTAGDPAAFSAVLRTAIDGLHPGVRLADENLQATLVANKLVEEKLLAVLSGFFSVVAIVLAAVGLYGVLSYVVVRRTREIGIRVALGAGQGSVVRLVLSEIGLVTFAGLGAGIGGGLLLARQVGALLYEVKPSDAASLAIPLAAVLATAGLAALAPGVRAARIDPAIALRCE